MDLAPEHVDRFNSQSPQPNLEEVLFVMGGHSMDDEDDSDEDEDRDPRLERLQPRNCAFYNTKTSKKKKQQQQKLFLPHLKFQVCLSSHSILIFKFVGKCLWDSSNQFGTFCRSLNTVLTEKWPFRNVVWM